MDDKHLPEETVTLPLPQLDPIGTAQAEGVATPQGTTVPSDSLQNPYQEMAEQIKKVEGLDPRPRIVNITDQTVEAPQVREELPGRVDSPNAVSAEPTETRCSACKPEKGKTINTDEQGLCVVCGKKPKHAGGRPCKYCTNKEELQKKADAYLERCKKGVNGKPIMPYIEELAIELDTIDSVLVDWAQKKNENGELEHPEFTSTYKSVTMFQKYRLKQRTMGRYNPTGAIFLLKANHGLMESEKKVIAGDKDEPLQIEVIEERPRNTDE